MNATKLVRIKIHQDRHDMKAQGTLKLKNAHLPFHYKVRADEDFDHEAHLDALEEKGLRWEKAAKKYAAWQAKKSDKIIHAPTGAEVEVEVRDCVLIPAALNDWHLYTCVVKNGVKHELTLRYSDPDLAMSVDELKHHIAETLLAKEYQSQKVLEHKEKVRAIAGETQAQAAWLLG